MDFASRISVLCFGASYAISMGAELLRFFWPGKATRWVATTFALAGLSAHSLFLAHRSHLSQQLPIGNQFESLIFVSWLVALVYLYLILRDRRLSAGIFVLPVSLALIGLATMLSPDEAANTDRATGVLLMSHGILILVATVVVLVAMVVAIMYLVKLKQLRTGAVFVRLRLPSLERLDRINRIAVYVAWPLLTAGLGLGLIAARLRLDDPKVISTLVAWVVLTVLAHYRYRPDHRGQRVAVMTIIVGIAVLFSFLGDPIFGTAHWQPPPAEERAHRSITPSILAAGRHQPDNAHRSLGPRPTEGGR